MPSPMRHYATLMTVVCLSVCVSVCHKPDPKSRMEVHSELKIVRREAP